MNKDRQPIQSSTIMGLKRRHRSERRFRMYGLISVLTALGFLVAMLTIILTSGCGAFQQTVIELNIHFDQQKLDPKKTNDPAVLARGDYRGLVKTSLREAFPEVRSRSDKRKLYKLMSSGAGFELRRMVLEDPSLVGSTRVLWLTASDDVDMVIKGNVDLELNETERRTSNKELGWIKRFQEEGRIKTRFNWNFLTSGDSREPELAGILGALTGSFLSLVVCLALSFPLGVLTAVYLEEFAPRNHLTDLIEININNLAAVPSIIFGLLGLAVFLNFFELPRSAPLVGGLVLALMTLPTVIIAGRASLKAVPPSIREAALALGASPLQAVFHQVLPLAMPGMLTGMIIGMARALGETAPLLMIGMVAFIVDIPQGITDPSTALPVQIYLWADSPERAFAEKTAAAIIVLLTFLMCMNLTAVILRKKFEKRW